MIFIYLQDTRHIIIPKYNFIYKKNFSKLLIYESRSIVDLHSYCTAQYLVPMYYIGIILKYEDTKI